MKKLLLIILLVGVFASCESEFNVTKHVVQVQYTISSVDDVQFIDSGARIQIVNYENVMNRVIVSAPYETDRTRGIWPGHIVNGTFTEATDGTITFIRWDDTNDYDVFDCN